MGSIPITFFFEIYIADSFPLTFACKSLSFGYEHVDGSAISHMLITCTYIVKLSMRICLMNR